MADRVTIALSTATARDFYGVFHAYVRARQTAGAAGDIDVQLRIETGSGGVSINSGIVQFTNLSPWQLLDMGEVRIPAATDLKSDEYTDAASVVIRAGSTSTGDSVCFYDVILMPADEWIGNFTDRANTADSAVSAGRLFDIDSIINPKADLRALCRESDAYESIVSIYQAAAGGPAILQANARQRLWFLTARTASVGSSDWRSEPCVSHSVVLHKVQRYLSGRGDR